MISYFLLSNKSIIRALLQNYFIFNTIYRERKFALRLTEKSFPSPLKFSFGNADIVSVRTKTLSAREVGDVPGGRSPNPRWTGCRRQTTQ